MSVLILNFNLCSSWVMFSFLLFFHYVWDSFLQRQFFFPFAIFNCQDSLLTQFLSQPICHESEKLLALILNSSDPEPSLSLWGYKECFSRHPGQIAHILSKKEDQNKYIYLQRRCLKIWPRYCFFTYQDRKKYKIITKNRSNHRRPKQFCKKKYWHWNVACSRYIKWHLCWNSLSDEL